MDEALKKTLIAKAAEVRHNARAFSGFHVGAALLTKSGEIVTGCNVELHTTLSSICAERTAMVKACPWDTRNSRAIAVVSDSTSPYPLCVLPAISGMDFDPDIQVIMGQRRRDRVVEMTASELLPMAFMGSGRDK